MYTQALRPLLFRLEPERAHALTLHLLHSVGKWPALQALARRLLDVPTAAPVQAFGLRFPNAVGLAAGYDKDAWAWRGLACLGFGHIEVGTVTPEPQPGNPRPRVFRLPEESGLINRLGFPSRGAAFAAAQLKGKRPASLLLGVNLGKNASTPLEQAAEDYLRLVPIFAPLADYLVVNVSSPNTPGLRRLQDRDALEALLAVLQAACELERKRLSRPVPLLVKLSPDLTDDGLDDALAAATQTQTAGIVATNTTTARAGIGSPWAKQAGGLSGGPLRARSEAFVKKIHARTSGELPIVGVGGILSAEDARRMLDAGASLVQIYTGLIYRGPGLIREILLSI